MQEKEPGRTMRTSARHFMEDFSVNPSPLGTNSVIVSSLNLVGAGPGGFGNRTRV